MKEFNLISLTDKELTALTDLLAYVRKYEAESFEIYVSDTLEIDFNWSEDQLAEAMAFDLVDHPYKTAVLIDKIINP